jgi:uncharacterized membrane protein
MAELRKLARWSSDRSLPTAVASSALAILVLIGGPLALGQRPTHRFLVWHLALAWVPYVAALLLEKSDRARKPVSVVISAGVWLLFLPNAPYLVSDLSHLPAHSPTPWLDLARLVAFAWAGCLLGVASLRIVHLVVAERAGSFAGWAMVCGAAFASGIGIALGRFARLNSWEAITRPSAVIDEAMRLGGSVRAVGVAGFFSLLVLVVYTGLGGLGPARLRRRPT